MTNDGIKLDMYLASPSKAVFARLETRLRTILTDADIDLTADFATGFAVGQICGITFANAPAGQLRYLATFVADAPTVPAGHYNSILVTPRENGLSTPADFDPARHKVVINETSSFSGNLTFAAHMAAEYNTGLGTPLASGAHLKSIGMVARGKADLAAIDRISFALARHTVPEDVAGVTVIGETASHPGVPFVADASLPEDVITRLQTEILAFREDPAWAEMHSILGLSDITVLDQSVYPPMSLVAA